MSRPSPAPLPQAFDLAARARTISLQLTAWPSVTGSKDEAVFALRLAGMLRALPYFQANPADLVVAPLPGDPLGRANVLALVRGRGTRTVTLSGHFDTVTTEDYGPLQDLAGEAEALRDALIAKLEATGADPLALADLKSGDFLPGRGLLDMKSGLAAGIAALEAFAAEPDRDGNLLLIATPDEEDRSAGMRAAADLLPGFLAERGLDAKLGINLDAINDPEDGEYARVVAFGCIGKLLLSAFVVGKEAHAAYPFDGVNAAYLAAELVSEMECAPELAEDACGELAAPPTALGSRDLKNQYNVTVPGTVWTYWNVLIHRRPSTEIMAVARTIAQRAVDRARARLAERAARLRVPVEVTPAWNAIRIVSFAEVKGAAMARDPGFEARFADLAEALAQRPDLDLPTRARQLTEAAWQASGLAGPAVVLGFGSMPYPSVTWRDEDAELRRDVLAAAQETAAAHGTSIRGIDYFPAIADMSYLGPVDAKDLAAAASETPLWGNSIRWNLSQGATPGIPLINIGPWGRDYHHWLERVHAPYAFEVLPAIVQAVARRVLSG
ncbi:MAG TPA: M20/M25/M40 family metallo-hydrolase [Beijerinckiaceae bacterium]|jgi:arginine utilization protein RocB